MCHWVDSIYKLAQPADPDLSRLGYTLRCSRPSWYATFPLALAFNLHTGRARPCQLHPQHSNHANIVLERIRRNLGLIQGFTTALYAIGLAAIAHAAHTLSETALWPLLTKRNMTLGSIETYLEASRGSIPASPSALYATRSFHAFVVVLCTVIITLVSISGAPLVGYTYQRDGHFVKFQSVYRPGGGVGPLFSQTSPPESIRGNPASLYTSWASGFASEPLPDYRTWFLDRATLADRGNLSVMGVNINQNITCYAWRPPKPQASENNTRFVFLTKMKERDKRHGKEVVVLPRSRLTVWAHDYEFVSKYRTRSTLAFAVVNGTIDGGEILDDLPRVNKIRKISTIACDVDLEFVDDHLEIGQIESRATPISINSLANIRRRGGNSSATLNELMLWFTVSPITIGASVAGAQPMFRPNDKNYTIPIIYPTDAREGFDDQWNITYIENFVKVAIGASALGESTNSLNFDPVEFISFQRTVKLDPRRPVLLIVPPLVILFCAIILLVWNLYMHHQMQVPIMRLATLSEFIKSSQTKDLRRIAMDDMQNSNRPTQLDNVAIEFREISRIWGLQTALDQQGSLPEHDEDSVAIPQEQVAGEWFQTYNPLPC